MPNNRKEQTWSEWFQVYFLCPEALQLYAIIGIGAFIKHRAGGEILPEGEKLKEALKSTSYVWAPSATTLLVNSLGTYLGRMRENREVTRVNSIRTDEKLYLEMEAHQKQGEEAILRKSYYEALENLSECREIYAKLFNQDIRLRAKQLYLGCIFREGIALLGLKRYSEAEQQLTKSLADKNYLQDSYSRTLLLNLRGLIYYIRSRNNLYLSQEAVTELHKKAENDFKNSYLIDKDQNDIFYFIKYFKNDAKFLAENIPHPLLKPKTHLAIKKDSILLTSIIAICAEACVEKKSFSKAILLYNTSIDNSDDAPSDFFEKALLYMDCFKAYKELLTDAASHNEIKLLKIIYDEKIVDKKTQKIPRLAEETCSIDKVKTDALNKLAKAKAYLDNELFLTNNELDCAHAYINYGMAYIKLADLAKDDFADYINIDEIMAAGVSLYENAKEKLSKLKSEESKFLLEIVDTNLEKFKPETSNDKLSNSM